MAHDHTTKHKPRRAPVVVAVVVKAQTWTPYVDIESLSLNTVGECRVPHEYVTVATKRKPRYEHPTRHEPSRATVVVVVVAKALT